MKYEQAVKLAIKALEAEIARVQVDADLYDVWSRPRSGEGPRALRTPRRAAASRHRADCREAIEALRQPQQTTMALEEAMRL